jgi:spore coat protein U-like protein
MNIIYRSLGIATVAATIGAMSVPAFASSTTSNQAIGASVSNDCAITTNNTLAFGSYDPIAANATNDLSGSTTFSVACTKGASVTLSLGAGGNGGTYTNATRAMSSNSNLLAYELYTTNSNSTVWNSTNTVAYNGTGSSGTETIYGVIPHGQVVPAGAYTDSIVVTASY